MSSYPSHTDSVVWCFTPVAKRDSVKLCNDWTEKPATMTMHAQLGQLPYASLTHTPRTIACEGIVPLTTI